MGLFNLPLAPDYTTQKTDIAAFEQRFLAKLNLPEQENLRGLLSAHPAIEKQWLHTVAMSEYCRHQFLQTPQYFIEKLTHESQKDPTFGSPFKSGTEKSALENQLHAALAKVSGPSPSLADFDTTIRLFRNEIMWQIIWRDFNRLNTMSGTTQSLSALAEVCLQATLTYHEQALTAIHGHPQCVNRRPQGLLVIGMGKLGANELNLSSDIDLIFAFPEDGETQDQTEDQPTAQKSPPAEIKSLSNTEFFTRLGKRIINSLNKRLANGFVFRVDMRLRPYGQSGPLVQSFTALEHYYETQGRDWERYAMIKARIVAKSPALEASDAASQLDALLKAFTYRKYLDFSAIEALRRLKQLINQEVARRKLHGDIKLGAGGIREVEFIGQAFQFIRGGKEPELQTRQLLRVLKTLAQREYLPKATSQKLQTAYIFLRNTEHVLQGFRDEQTQQLPHVNTDQQRVALGMGFKQWDDFLDVLNTHRKTVQVEFEKVISDPQPKTSDDEHIDTIWAKTWASASDISTLKKHLDSTFDHATDAISTTLSAFWQEIQQQTMHEESTRRLHRFMPRVLCLLPSLPEAHITLCRLIEFVRAVVRRSTYLVLLIENPKALEQLVKLADASPWIAQQLANYPALLDELLDQTTLYRCPEKHELQDDLRRLSLRIPEDDLENQMEALRYFKSAHALRVAVCEISGVLPLMRVSDYLTHLADAILEYVVQLCWTMMVTRHGHPDGNETLRANFIILGYGKLGGIELGHGSDLDLVFVHGCSQGGQSNGDKPLDNATFFARLGQKIIHVLNTQTPSGKIYEVDMRLRPSGNSGMLVSSLSAFEKYHRQQAWTWEHQALVRTRVVAGEPLLAQIFKDLRQSILCQPRHLENLRAEVRDMRNKMRGHLSSKEKSVFELKQDTGGIIDIEFMVQYTVLAWAHDYPALVDYTDNIRILASLEHANLLSSQEVEQLTAAYKTYRSTGHRLTLQQQANTVDNSRFAEQRQNVVTLWHKLIEPAANKPS